MEPSTSNTIANCVSAIRLYRWFSVPTWIRLCSNWAIWLTQGDRIRFLCPTIQGIYGYSPIVSKEGYHSYLSSSITSQKAFLTRCTSKLTFLPYKWWTATDVPPQSRNHIFYQRPLPNTSKTILVKTTSLAFTGTRQTPKISLFLRQSSKLQTIKMASLLIRITTITSHLLSAKLCKTKSESDLRSN